MHDVDLFMESPEGKAVLDEIRESLQGRTILGVTFDSFDWGVTTRLHLDDGTTFFIAQPSLYIESLEEDFGDVIERERKKRRAKQSSRTNRSRNPDIQPLN